jgi:TetR/AcrR family transcriptional regulator, regulator of cefoperazone and chloramphenicol sensitivity
MLSSHVPDTSRGELARERMLHAALDLFGRHGFDATTTRMIANAAAMNLSAIPYYFGTKEGLYEEAAGHLAQYIEQQQASALTSLRQQTAQLNDRYALVEFMVAFVLAQARLLLADSVPVSWVQFFLRAQAEHGAAFEHIFASAVDPVQACLTELMARIIQKPADDTQTRLLAFMAMHQFVCLRLADSVLLRRLNWDALTPDRIEQILAIIGPNLRAQLLSAARLEAQS